MIDINRDTETAVKISVARLLEEFLDEFEGVEDALTIMNRPELFDVTNSEHQKLGSVFEEVALMFEERACKVGGRNWRVKDRREGSVVQNMIAYLEDLAEEIYCEVGEVGDYPENHFN